MYYWQIFQLFEINFLLLWILLSMTSGAHMYIFPQGQIDAYSFPDMLVVLIQARVTTRNKSPYLLKPWTTLFSRSHNSWAEFLISGRLSSIWWFRDPGLFHTMAQLSLFFWLWQWRGKENVRAQSLCKSLKVTQQLLFTFHCSLLDHTRRFNSHFSEAIQYLGKEEYILEDS